MALCRYCSRVGDEEHCKVCYGTRYPESELQTHLPQSIDQAITLEQANQSNENGKSKPAISENDNEEEHVTGSKADADTYSQKTLSLATELSQMDPVASSNTTISSQSEEDHMLNTQCRNDFLHFLSCCQGKEASLRIYECSRDLTCRVEAFQPQLKHIAVSNLTTPIGTEKSAIIRTSDLIQVRYFKENNSSI